MHRAKVESLSAKARRHFATRSEIGGEPEGGQGRGHAIFCSSLRQNRHWSAMMSRSRSTSRLPCAGLRKLLSRLSHRAFGDGVIANDQHDCVRGKRRRLDLDIAIAGERVPPFQRLRGDPAAHGNCHHERRNG